MTSQVMPTENDLRAPPKESTPSRHEPWSVDRWGRLIAGSSMLIFTALGCLVDQWFLIGTALSAANLVITALTGRCPLNRLLIRLGAREREDLFLPGGAVRPPDHER